MMALCIVALELAIVIVIAAVLLKAVTYITKQDKR